MSIALRLLDPAKVIGPPSGAIEIIGFYSLGFSLLVKGDRFVPPAREIEKEIECLAHFLEAWIWPRDEEWQSGGDSGPSQVEKLEPVTLFVTVLQDQHVGSIFEPIADFSDDLGPVLM